MITNDVITAAMNVGGDDGRMLVREMKVIADFINKYYDGGDTLEIGCYKGRVSYLFAYANFMASKGEKGNHYMVDVYELGIGDWNWGYNEHTDEMLLENLGQYNTEHMIPVKGLSLSHDVMSKVLYHHYDCAFIDGDHRFAGLLPELLVVDHLCDHIMCHDYGWTEVTDAIDKFCEIRGYSIKGFFEGPHGQPSGIVEIVKKKRKDGERYLWERRDEAGDKI